MTSSKLSAALCTASFFLTVISLVVADGNMGINRFIPMKKSSDAGLSSDFMSAMNGATRLRYGKRSDANMYNDLLAAAEFEALSPQQQAYALRMPRWANVKRMAAYNDLSGLVDQINGSERLRFGRK